MKNLVCCLVIVVFASKLAHADDSIVVAAAADLQFAMPELIRQYESHGEQKVIVSFGSSGNFASQIRNGAPFDLFFSADLSYPKQLEADGLIEPGSFYHYANGKLVLWTLKSSNIDISKGLTSLTESAVHKIAIANPEHAPYGRAAVAALKQEGIYEKVQDKIVLAENISQTAQFVDAGSADVGVIAFSLIASPRVLDRGNYFTVPASDYPPIEQACVILKSSKHEQAARQFLEFIRSPAGTAILQKFGFSTSKEPQ